MTKQCIACRKNVELAKDEETGMTFFHIMQATTIKIDDEGSKSAKHQSTSYLCQMCLEGETVKWSQLIHHLWGEREIHLE